ncbi:MAG: NOB1 family endonuclease [Candidatus Bathyarchaeia archaeon]
MVLDTSAFIAGFDPFSIVDDVYSVGAVEVELASGSLPWVRFKTAVENRKLKLRAPKAEFLDRVKESSRDVGDMLFLSDVDLQVLALALELKSAGNEPLIVTDDYSIQNVADQLGLEFAPLMTFGIRFRLHWIRYCPACRRKYPPDYKHRKCEVCGTELKRKPLRKTALKKE